MFRIPAHIYRPPRSGGYFSAQPLNLTELISKCFCFLLANSFKCFYPDNNNPEYRATLRSDPSAEIDVKWMEALAEIILELKSDATPQIIANVIEDKDKIVRATRFDGWQSTHAGQKEIQKVLRQTLFKYKLQKEQELFEKAYEHIREHY